MAFLKMEKFGARYLKIMGHNTLLGRACSKAISESQELLKILRHDG
jgi:hypothetical protein